AYDTILVDESTRVVGHRFVIATGSRPAIPDIPGLAEAGYLDGDSVWSLTRLPESLIVIGSDPRGLEFAQCFARLGTKVTLLTDAPRILPQEDPETSELLTRVLTEEGVALCTAAEVSKIDVHDGRKVCKIRNNTIGSTEERGSEAILLASGRLANVESLN